MGEQLNHATNKAAGSPTRRTSGVVTFYHGKGHYGFIQDGEGDAYFFHDMDVAEDNGYQPVNGQPVVFLRSSNDRGLKAEQVSLMSLAEPETVECQRCDKQVIPRAILGPDNSPWCTVCPDCMGGLSLIAQSTDADSPVPEAGESQPGRRITVELDLPAMFLIGVLAVCFSLYLFIG